jgi:hypothetical protein
MVKILVRVPYIRRQKSDHREAVPMLGYLKLVAQLLQFQYELFISSS